MAITDVAVRRAKPQDKAYRISDGGSMFLWVTPAGGKLWRWAYMYERAELRTIYLAADDIQL